MQLLPVYKQYQLSPLGATAEPTEVPHNDDNGVTCDITI
jgi:hypothetical protein